MSKIKFVKGSTTMVLVFILWLIVLAVVGGIASFASYNNTAVSMEENIVKLDKSSESLLSNGAMTILEKAKVKDSYAEDFTEQLRVSIGSRSANEQGLAMKWIKEHNPSMNDQLYLDLSAYIEGMRRDFHVKRDSLQDACSTYKIELRSFPGKIAYNLFGFPNIDLNDKCKVISDKNTSEAFDTGIQKSIL